MFGLQFYVLFPRMYVCIYRFENVFLRCPTPRLHCFISSHWPSFRFLSLIFFLIYKLNIPACFGPQGTIIRESHSSNTAYNNISHYCKQLTCWMRTDVQSVEVSMYSNCINLMDLDIQCVGGSLSTVLVSPLKTKRRPLYLKTQSVPRCKHFSSGL